MRIGITGSNGFIGKNVVSYLKLKGFEVEEISRSKGLNIAHWEEVKDIHSCDFIIHLAAKTFVPDSFDDPRSFYEFNLISTINTLELAKKWKAKVIYLSSYFYGPPQYIPVDERHSLHPHNPYARTKFLSEELCKSYALDFSIPTIAFRLFNVYGPGQKGQFLIPEILEKIQLDNKIVLKDPRPKRDYIFVEDVVSAIYKCLMHNWKGFEIFNLGTGISYSVEELVSIIASYSEKEIEVEFTHEYRKGEVLDSVADVSKITRVLGWHPRYDLESGIKAMMI